uniref:Uncharacterized protein n=1 Tax=Takifugu rubripes TaxID=31033 RepID=A0A3B5K3J1_TAKRU
MSLRDIWKNYKVLIVMGSSLGLIHLGWYQLKANPLLHKTKEELTLLNNCVLFLPKGNIHGV